jgi:hypothetical protein
MEQKQCATYDLMSGDHEVCAIVDSQSVKRGKKRVNNLIQNQLKR